MKHILKYLQNIIKVGAFSLILLVLLSCAGSRSVKTQLPEQSSAALSVNKSLEQETPVEGQVVNAAPMETTLNSKKISLSQGSADLEHPYSGDYVIGPEDLLQIEVYEVDELKKIVRVSSSGFIKLPLVGQVKASGLTAAELETEIGKKLEPYLQEPLVSIFIKEYRAQNITILGAVSKPQVYTVTNQKYLIDMLSLAGGLTKDAGDICYVRRADETLIVNIKDLLVKGDMRLNVPVFSGDIIHVPVGGIVFVDGAVNSPGSFSMSGTITLTQAIAMAKGLKFEAVRDQVRIYRDSGKAERDIIEVSYDAIIDNKSPDINLIDKDVVIIAKSGLKSTWKGFVNSLSGAFRFGSSVSVGAGF